MLWFKLKCNKVAAKKHKSNKCLRYILWHNLLLKKESYMAKKRGEYLANDPDYVPDPEIEEFMELEISRAPKDPDLLANRLRNNTAASPRDAGGDLDADWEDVNASGSETVAGDNPTPDQSLVEENAQAMGVSYEDNEELEFIDKIEKRDRDRYELDENSKASENMI
jgi:Family of unknown function (DUF6335)